MLYRISRLAILSLAFLSAPIFAEAGDPDAIDREIEAMEKKIQLLEKKKQVMQLEQEIADIESKDPVVTEKETEEQESDTSPAKEPGAETVQTSTGKKYSFAVKVGEMQFGISEFKDSSTLAIVAGWQLSDTLGLEAEYGSAEGDLQPPLNLVLFCLSSPFFFACADDSYDMEYYSVYATWKSQEKAYLKARAGVLYEDINGFSDTGLSFGMGGGYRLQENLAAELEFTIIEQDANFLGLGLVYTF